MVISTIAIAKITVANSKKYPQIQTIINAPTNTNHNENPERRT